MSGCGLVKCIYLLCMYRRLHRSVCRDLCGSALADYTVKNIRRFYGKITGNQPSVHFPVFFTGARKHFQESSIERWQKKLLFFFIIQPYNPTKVFSSTVD